MNGGLDNSWYEVVAKPRVFSPAQRAAFIAGLALVLTLLNVYAPASPTVTERLLSTLTLAFCALPLWLWLSGIDRSVPFMAFFGIVYSSYYAVPFFLLERYSQQMFTAPFSDSLMTRALGLVLVGLLAALLGYYGPGRLAFARILPRPVFRWRSCANVKLWAMIFSLAGLLIYMLKITTTLPLELEQFAVFGGELCSIGICMLFVIQLTGRLDRVCAIFLWGMFVPLRVSVGLSTGFTASALVVPLMLLITYAAVRRRMPWKTLVLGAVALFLVRPAMTPLRELTWKRGSMYQASIVEKTKLAYALVAQNASDDVAYDLLFQYSLLRVAINLRTLPEVLRDTPEHVSYWKGATYYPLMFKLMPRFVYADKPKEETGQTFGHRYGLLDPSDNETSYNLPQLIELYANFGMIGVLLGMFFYGLIGRALQEVFVHPGTGLGGVVGGVYVSVLLLAIDSAASLMLGALFWLLVFFGLIHLVVEAGELCQNRIAPPR